MNDPRRAAKKEKPRPARAYEEHQTPQQDGSRREQSAAYSGSIEDIWIGVVVGNDKPYALDGIETDHGGEL